MFRLTRPLLQHALKASTGITGVNVHPNPLPALVETYQSTLARVSEIPQSSVYRQSVEALTQRKLKIVQDAKGDVAAAEEALDEGQIEEAIGAAQDELNLVGKMIEWKAWEPLEEKPQPGQWEYFGKATQFK
ncbi:NADH2 dehydrogenase [Fomitiporia mediterranea MF3/22]|uniref:NADH2 dehydrogenase n=1 Tax=Fomitiporia mediterranea (strain MF3/22) TaxID=694068 RepID=UPI0004407C92|nr:NADH2 dehydrogenase [Fomitiporia mediterranea MF3/22]EJD03929.1 NADH2 dehydrogenase [Fomitiporia mediterranea MF3/22]